jgi:hypothetical protein
VKALLALLTTLALSSQAVALPPGVPDPVNSTVVLSPPAAPCHYRFRADGGLDVLTATITILDSVGAGAPVGNCLVTGTLVPQGAATLAFCACPPCISQTGTTNALGVTTLTFRKIGGRGLLGLQVVACGGIVIGTTTFQFTSPDLNGSCEATPASATTVVDLGLWASYLPPFFSIYGDYNCDGAVNVVDLGIWGSGLNKSCNGICP